MVLSLDGQILELHNSTGPNECSFGPAEALCGGKEAG
jgi:hypothetical protein